MTLVGRKASCINLDQDVKSILVHEYGITNLSDFINKLLWAYVEENEPEIPLEAQRIIRVNSLAKKLRTEHLQQRKLLEEEQSAEQIARDMMVRDEAIFLNAAKDEFPSPDLLIDLLPEISEPSNEYWETRAKSVSIRCNFPVSSEKVISYIRKVTHVVS